VGSVNGKQFLALLEVDKIQGYVFATNKLREIRGASSLLSEINEVETLKILKKKYSSAECPILSVGGMTKVVFDNKDDTQARAFLNEMERVYRERLISASVTTHIEPINGDFPSALSKGEKAIRVKKESKQYSFQLNTSPYHKRCSLCGIYPAVKKSWDQYDEKYDWLCASCLAKREQKRELKIYEEIIKKFKEESKKVDDFPYQLSQIGKVSQKEGYMGFIMADANRMGEKLRKIKSPEELSQFAGKFAEINQQCLIDAICNAFKNTNLEGNLLPVNILIFGGDDTVMVTTADTAIKIAVEYCEKFQKCTQNVLSDEISISAGVVIAKDSYPINSYIALGEELLKLAKRKNRHCLATDKKEETGTIDYKVVTASSAEPIRITRYKEEYYQRNGDEFYLTSKPYTLEDMKKLVSFCVRFKESNFPRNKIKSLEKILRLGRETSILEFSTLKSRLPEKQERLMNDFLQQFKLVNQMPWKKDGNRYETNLLDLVEIYDFCEKE